MRGPRGLWGGVRRGSRREHRHAPDGWLPTVEYLVEELAADVTFVSRRGQTTVDMANGPQQRVQPFPEMIALLESMGAKNNHNCLCC